MNGRFTGALLAKLSPRRQAWLRRQLRPAHLGTLRRVTPLSYNWGFDRGTPVDRYYIDHFLSEHRADIRGRALEIKSCDYVARYGTMVEQCDVLDIDPANQAATFVADLAAASAIPDAQFDCFVLTQTLQFIYDLPSALDHSCRILRPGGVLLATVPSVSKIDRRLARSDFWRFTAASCASLFGAAFGPGNVEVRAYGNVLAATAFLMGMAAEELNRDELETEDPLFPVIVGVRAEKV